MPKHQPPFLRLVVSNSEKKSSGSSGMPFNLATVKTSDCRLDGITPRRFQDETVVGGAPNVLAICRTPPKRSTMRSTELMMSKCTHAECNVNSFLEQAPKSRLLHYEYMPRSMRKALREIEQLAGLSGRALARRAKIHPSTYNNFKDRNLPSIKHKYAEKLAKVLESLGKSGQPALDLSEHPVGRPLTGAEIRAIELLDSAPPNDRERMLAIWESFVESAQGDSAQTSAKKTG